MKTTITKTITVTVTVTETTKWLDKAKEKMGGISDYALAPKLGLSRSQISNYRNGRDFLSDDAAMKLAELLEIDPTQIIASAHAERAKSEPARAFWMQWAERLGGVTAAAVIGVGLSAAPAPAKASYADSVYYVNKRKRYNFWSGLSSGCMA